jgi:uncharacterized phage protein (TIGR02216 family)
MALGLGVLRLPPDHFWSMTLREMTAAIQGAFPDEPQRLAKAGLDSLMQRYPDR